MDHPQRINSLEVGIVNIVTETVDRVVKKHKAQSNVAKYLRLFLLDKALVSS